MNERGEKKIRSVFKRMETDAEYRARLIAAGIAAWHVGGKKDKELDAVGDDVKMQRQIVEDVA